MFAGCLDEHVVAGGIANRSGAVVRLSNVFDRTGSDDATWAAPLVGYQQPGRGLDAARACGFEVADALRVWLREAGSVSMTKP